MDKNWLNREMTLDDLNLPPELESEFADDLRNELDNGLPYMEDLDPDAEYLKLAITKDDCHSLI